MLVTQANATSGYFTEDNNNIEIWIDVDEPTGCTGGAIEIIYDSSCADAVSYTPATGWIMNTCNSATADVEFITMIANPIDGPMLVGTVTFECKSDNCETTLEFGSRSSLNNGSAQKIADVEWIPLTFKCGNGPVPPGCLGDCIDETGDVIASNVPCYECLVGDGPGVKWINYPCTANDCGCTCDPMEHTDCPECCDGVDNDFDGLIDMDDPKCGCCIDGNETNGDDPCPPPCIPELPTLAFMSIGILGMFLLVRKRG